MNFSPQTMKTIRIHITLALTTLFGAALLAHDKSAPLDAAQKFYLTHYEAVRAALAADNLPAAKSAASSIANQLATIVKEQPKAQPALDAAQKLRAADSLKIAREAFKPLSKRAVHLASNQKGYYLANCPMVEGGDGDWVQTSATISNPYFGKAMLTCGSIKE